MSIFSTIGSIFDPSGAAQANAASASINSALSPNSPYWQSTQLTGDQGILQGAAALQQNPVTLDTSAVDADTGQMQALQGLYGGIAQNGGMASQAAQAQAASNLANTGISGLRNASETNANSVLGVDSAERNMAAQGANQTRAQILAAALKKQTWNTSISHANFEAALAGTGLQNQDTDLAQSLALAGTEGARAASNSQLQSSQQLQQQDFNNTMMAAQIAASVAGQAGSTISSMSGGATPTNTAAAPTAPTLTSNGYALPSPAVGASKIATAPSQAAQAYTNPVTGNTVNANYPTDTSSWASWLSGGSSLVA